MQKVLFAFSGGIDDVLSIHWLRRTRGYAVVALLANLGQRNYLEPLGELALESGAEGTLVVDLQERFAERYVFPTLVAGASYENYLLSTPLARYAICEEMVDRARELGIEVLGHGSSGHGNDQVRFKSSVAALNPKLDVIAPLMERNYRSMEERRNDLLRFRLPERPEFNSDVSVDRNLWGCGSVHGELGDPWKVPDESVYHVTLNPSDAPDEAQDIVIGFRKGIPVSVDDDDFPSVELIERLSEIGGTHGIGRLDHVENRLLGGKTREIYEAPGATILYTAHSALEEITQTRSLNRYKRLVSEEYGRLVYEGLWFSELREALDSFFRTTQRYVTGRVKLRLFKGSCSVIGRESQHSLYDTLVETAEGRSALRGLASGYVDILSMPARSEASHRDKDTR